MLALRVEKIDPNAGQPAKKGKRVKGLWTVKIVGQQDAGDDMYYAWLYEGSQVKRKVYSVLALIAIFIIVCYPLWPLKMRLGVYYLSWGFLWLLAGFFAMAIFRVILFCITYFILSPGLWLFPNLWEDVSFMDSFKPVWAWHEVRTPLLSGTRIQKMACLLTSIVDDQEKEEVQVILGWWRQCERTVDLCCDHRSTVACQRHYHCHGYTNCDRRRGATKDLRGASCGRAWR